ncbi:MAG: ATP-binding protein [Muribaculaceae bacterium]|nr:ATP-binding protein [Muribaculaceae bacterium]MDE6753192.1 ATP-binding protein [Muribaculaceae bacterium]
MIVALKFKNFFSLRDETVIDFTADITTVRNANFLPQNLIKHNSDLFINIIGLFGSNAAGKTNLIKAMQLCRNMVINSGMPGNNVWQDFTPFKFSSSCPAEFYIDFIYEGVEYEYSYSIQDFRILTENLFYYPKKKRARIFSRLESGEYHFGKGVVNRPAEIVASTGPEALFLSRAASMNRELPRRVYDFFLNNIVTDIPGFRLEDLSRNEFETYREIILKSLEVSDSDIIDIQWQENLPGEIKLVSRHKENPGIAFDFEREESEGTKRLFFLVMLLLKNLNNDLTIFWDEFDLKLHLRLAEFILDLVRASKSLQLVFTSHNPYLLDAEKMRPEQIVIVNKDLSGNSEFIPLSDYEGIGKMTDFGKAYLIGRFDGVPYTGNIYGLVNDLKVKNEEA